MRFLFLLALLFSSVVAVAQSMIPTAQDCGMLCQVLGQFPQINMWVFVIFTVVGMSLRVLSELIAFLALQLDKSDNGVASKLAEYSMYCAKIIGWFGGGQSQKVQDWFASDPLPSVKAVVAPPVK